MSAYQPKTGVRCGCRPGVWRDNCPNCEGTGWQIDFRAIRARAEVRAGCDGSGPHEGCEVRVLPVGGDGNAILCKACFVREIAFRRERNEELTEGSKFDLPAWDRLKVYGL